MATSGRAEARAEREIAALRDLLGDARDRAVVTAEEIEDALSATLARAREQDRRASASRSWRPVWIAAAAVGLLAILLPQLVSEPATARVPASLTYAAGVPQDVADGRVPGARKALLDLADVAGQEAPALERGSVHYVATFGWYLEADGDEPQAAIVPTSSQWWLAGDGSARLSQRRSSAMDPRGRIDPDAAESAAGEWSSDTFPAGTFSANGVGTLPVDPARLRASLLESSASACGTERAAQTQCLVTAVIRLFTQNVVPPDRAASLWTVLAEEPSLAYLGETTDRLGRSVLAIAAPPLAGDVDPVVTILLIDETTGQLVGSEEVTLRSRVLDIHEASVTSFTTIEESVRVASIGATP